MATTFSLNKKLIALFIVAMMAVAALAQVADAHEHHRRRHRHKKSWCRRHPHRCRKHRKHVIVHLRHTKKDEVNGKNSNKGKNKSKMSNKDANKNQSKAKQNGKIKGTNKGENKQSNYQAVVASSSNHQSTTITNNPYTEVTNINHNGWHEFIDDGSHTWTVKMTNSDWANGMRGREGMGGKGIARRPDAPCFHASNREYYDGSEETRRRPPGICMIRRGLDRGKVQRKK